MNNYISSGLQPISMIDIKKFCDIYECYIFPLIDSPKLSESNNELIENIFNSISRNGSLYIYNEQLNAPINIFDYVFQLNDNYTIN